MSLKLKNFEIISLKTTTVFEWGWNGRETIHSEASLKIKIGGKEYHVVAEESSHNQAFFKALKKALSPLHPELEGILLGMGEDVCNVRQIASELDDVIELEKQECQ